ncbi:MAG: hypothetical protein QXZ13_00145 [Candidatus Diapherotrites archaeon]
MFLEKPAFPVSCDLGCAEEKVSNFFDSNNAKNHSFIGYELEYVPYYFFSFDAYKEEKNQTKVVEQGNNALNANNGNLEPKLSNLILQIENPSKEIKHNYQYKVIQPRINEKEAEKLIRMRLASKYQTTKDLVVISGLTLNFVPFWKLRVNVGGKKFFVCVNGFDGSIECKDNFPKKENNFEKKDELQEAIKDVSEIKNWPSLFQETIYYFIEKLISIINLFNNKKEHSKKEIKFDKTDLLVILLALIAIIIVIYVLLLR